MGVRLGEVAVQRQRIPLPRPCAADHHIAIEGGRAAGSYGAHRKGLPREASQPDERPEAISHRLFRMNQMPITALRTGLKRALDSSVTWPLPPGLPFEERRTTFSRPISKGTRQRP